MGDGMSLKYPLQDQTALITGASRGLGLAIAEAFYQEGAHLILVARNQSQLDDVRNRLLSQNAKDQCIDVMTADFADVQSVSHLMTQLSSRMIHILVNNA